MKIYTKRGDNGKTDLFGGQRVSKANQRVRAYGAIDAANSYIGFVTSSDKLDPTMVLLLKKIMSDLFDLGAELATAETVVAQKKMQGRLDTMVDDSRIDALEKEIDLAENQLVPLRSFILPTGNDLAARFHLARSAVRQAEIEVVALQDQGESIREAILKYINRLSDLMFVFSRLANHNANVTDILWEAKKNR